MSSAHVLHASFTVLHRSLPCSALYHIILLSTILGATGGLGNERRGEAEAEGSLGQQVGDADATPPGTEDYT